MTQEEVQAVVDHAVMTAMSSEKKLIESVLPWLRAFVAGSFFFGTWVATLQATMNQMRGELDGVKIELSVRRDRAEESARSTATLVSEVTTVRAEQAEMKQDIKAILMKVK